MNSSNSSSSRCVNASLSTWLTCSLHPPRHGARHQHHDRRPRRVRISFAQTDYGFDMLVGPKASPLQLVLNTIYHLDVSPGNIPYSLYEDMATGRPLSADGKKNPYRGLIQWAVPYAVGDSYKAAASSAPRRNFSVLDENSQPLPAEKIAEYRGGERYTFAEGRALRRQQIRSRRRLRSRRATPTSKSAPPSTPPTASPAPTTSPTSTTKLWTVVGVLNETHTANDKALFIPLPTFYAIFEHEAGLEAINQIKGSGVISTQQHLLPPPPDSNPPTKATRPQPRRLHHPQAPQVRMGSLRHPRQIPIRRHLAPNPIYPAKSPRCRRRQPRIRHAAILRHIPLRHAQLLIVISALVTIVGPVSILVSIYNSVTARNREIAIMRALGATRSPHPRDRLPRSLHRRPTRRRHRPHRRSRSSPPPAPSISAA